MGYFHLNSGCIQGFAVNKMTNSNGVEVVDVTIDHEEGSNSFSISTDENHRNLNSIEADLVQGLTTAKETDAPFQINEYKERFYLFVIYPDGRQEKYTGSRF